MSRAVRDNSKAVSLFPFLAVLLCTMGALLVLLVVLAEQASRVVATDKQPATKPRVAVAAQPVQPKPVKPIEPPAKSEFELLRERREQQLRDKSAIQERLSQERAKLSHLEEHTRRLDHRLAQLYMTNEQLKATEGKQSVDREQAKRELARLEQLVSDSRTEVEELRKKANGPKRTVIIPYQGANGTFRPPIYIECSKKGMHLRPSGMPLKASDFADAIRERPSNALAAAVRATEHHYAITYKNAGEEVLEPYPLLIVRPSGNVAFMLAKEALEAAEIDYGYQYVGEDKPLEFGDVEPQLVKSQMHAVATARTRLKNIAESAPRRYTRVLKRTNITGKGRSESGGLAGNYSSGNGNSGGSFPGASGDQASQFQSSYGGNFGDASETSSESFSALRQQDGIGGIAQPGSGGGQRAGSGNSGTGSNSEQETLDAAGSLASGSGREGSGSEGASGEGTSNGAGNTAGAGQEGGAPGGQLASGTASGQASRGTASAHDSNGAALSGLSTADNSNSNNVSATFANEPEVQSAAIRRGADWALKKTMRESVPMRRPIPVAVRKGGIEVLPTPGNEDLQQRAFITYDQPTKKLLAELVEIIQDRTDDWGFAGRRMHWKPVLRMQVEAGEYRQASKLERLLEGSGIEVETPQATANAQGGKPYVQR